MIYLISFLSLFAVVTSNGGQMSSTEVQYCCNLASDMKTCHSACMKFASSCPPTVQNKTEYLKDFCNNSETLSSLDVCLSNTNKSSPQPETTPSQELLACCGQSTSEDCRDVCIEQIYAGVLDDNAIEAVIAQCGPPITLNADPIWSCFFNFADGANGQSEEEGETDECTPSPSTEEVTDPPLTITYADWARLQCCSRANTTGCREACLLEYSGNRIGSSWEKLNTDCVYQPNENELSTCLHDVTSECTLGCAEMSFCENFNNRPLQLFRRCNKAADDEAKTNYNRWKQLSTIILPLVTIQTREIETCLPDLWKAAACAIYTQPCDERTHSTVLCRDYCLLLMRECSVTQGLNPEEICNILSPIHLQDRCVSFGQFTEPSNLNSSDAMFVVSPCLSNPCADDRQCVVNHDCSGNEDRSCIPYSCVGKSEVGKPTEMSLVALDVVHVSTLPKNGRRCFGFVQAKDEEFGQQLVHLSNQYCKPVIGCSLNGEEYDHGEVFNVSDGCNFCSCSFGRLTCTRQVCLKATGQDLGQTALLSCDCRSFYQPVCTRDGRTLPNYCIAKCLGYAVNEFKLGSCADEDPCDSSPCPQGTKCVPHRHICLAETNHTVSSCPQYKCESYNSCGKFTSPVCDKSGSQHNSLCDIFFTQQTMDYFGYCQKECDTGRSVRVCGVNGETYPTKCHALQEGVAIDYVGECLEVPSGSHGCDIVKCPGVQYFSQHEVCDGPVPPGACCKQCGAMVNVIIDEDDLKKSRVALNSSSINSTDIISRMRDHMDVLDCRLNGYIALDGSLVLLLTPTNYSNFINVEACNTEAVRLTTLINNHSPVLATDPFLQFLKAANPSLAGTVPAPILFPNSLNEPSGCGQLMAPLLGTLSLLVMLVSSLIIH